MLRPRAFPACIDRDAKQTLGEAGPNQQGIERFDCKATPLTPASNGALLAPRLAAGDEGARQRFLLPGLRLQYGDQHSQLAVGE